MQDSPKHLGLVRLRHGYAPRSNRDFKAIGPLTAGATAISSGDIPGDLGGLVLAHMRLQMVYWGAAWDALSALRSQLDAAARSILSGPYVLDLAEYRPEIGTGSVEGSVVIRSPEPQSGFDELDVSGLLRHAFNVVALTQPVDGNNAYLVFTPPGVTLPTMLGAHTTFFHAPAGRRIHFGWVTSANDSTADFTCTMSHEIAELITDPEFNAIRFTTPADTVEVREIADACEECYALVDGTVVQAWFSKKRGGCHKP